MSLKRRIQFQARNFLYVVNSIALPAWMSGVKARIFLSFIFTFFAVAYIVKISSAAIGGYDIHSLENQTAALENEIRKLETQVVADSSMQSIQKRLSEINMVAVFKIKHISLSDEMAVAKK